MPRRYRVFCWAVPLICVQWLATALIDPNVGAAFRCVKCGSMLATLFGQTTLAASWTALGPGPLRWRLPLSLLWISSLPAAIAINGCVHQRISVAEDAVVIGICIFGQWTIAQAPLWALAIWLGLRLHHADDPADRPDHRERQFGIRHLMLITVLVAVIFSIGRTMVSGSNGLSPWILEMMTLASFLALAAIVLPLPLLFAGLLPRRALPAVLAVLILIGFATAGELAIKTAVLGSTHRPDLGDFVSINAFTAVTILAAAVVLRLNGYRITTMHGPGPCQSGI
jgi:hypothetical protein